jgi:hypothetical protein
MRTFVLFHVVCSIVLFIVYVEYIMCEYIINVIFTSRSTRYRAITSIYCICLRVVML